MGGIFGKAGSFVVDHQYDNIPLESRQHGSIATLTGGTDLPEYEKEPMSLIETPAEKKARKRSHLVAYATMFVMSIGFSIVLTGVYPYMQLIDSSLEKTALGWVVAANPLGQMIASPLLGFWGYKVGSIRMACITTIICFIFGNALYSMLSLFDDLGEHSAYYFMIFFRFIVGVSSANVTLCRSYLAQSTTLKERTVGIAVIAASQALGFVVGPAIQAILAIAIPDDVDTGVDWFQWNKYTAAGWIAALLGLINLILMMPCIFKEFDIAEKERALVNSGKQENKEPIQFPKPCYIGLAGILLAFFLVLFIYVLIETLITPLVMDQYAWTSNTAMIVVGAGLSAMGFFSIGSFMLSGYLSKRMDERFVMIVFGFIPTIIGTFLHIPIFGGPIEMQICNLTNINISSEISYGNHLQNIELTILNKEQMNGNIVDNPLVHALHDIEYQIHDSDTYEYNHNFQPYVTIDPETNCTTGCPQVQTWCNDAHKLVLPQLAIAFTIITFGYPIANSLTQAIFSKMLGPRPQGLWMGVLTGVGSLSRITGPIFVSYIYTSFGTAVTFSIITGAMLLALVVLLILYKKLIPMEIPKLDPNVKY